MKLKREFKVQKSKCKVQNEEQVAHLAGTCGIFCSFPILSILNLDFCTLNFDF